ncbi:helix-turn-helix domain-containing protein [Streptomyces spiramyceticus]|uniref:helix-turn-helix domain-containing protein n=1 Tax=Streptomyces spiramyceticus TaxID=299717 RepID=UPI00237C1EE7|nr:helix-turn-helix transcriptional regulator [Streptomyces spiramyceticus]
MNAFLYSPAEIRPSPSASASCASPCHNCRHIRRIAAACSRSSEPPLDWVLARRRAIGDQIRAARLHANLTQQAVAERAGMDKAIYVRVERGHPPR